MGNDKFEAIVKKVVAAYANQRLGYNITELDVFVVWSCKTLQNNKALASTTVTDGMYYELTYNGDVDELYLDAYKKRENVCINNPTERFWVKPQPTDY